MCGEIVRVTKGFDEEGDCGKTGDRFVGDDGSDLGYFDNSCKENDGETYSEGERGSEAEGIG